MLFLNKSESDAMFDVLEKLRQKPEPTRRRIALLSAFSITLVIFIVWMTVIMPDWTQNQNKQAEALSSQPSPWSAISANFATGMQGITAGWSVLHTLAGSFDSGTDHYVATTTVATSTAPDGAPHN